MKLEVDTSATGVAKITLNVPSDEFAKEVRNGLKVASQNVRMKGFRPGKVPVKMLEKQYGEAVRGEVKERFVQKAYGQAISENELKPIAHPRLSPDAMDLSEDGSFSAEFEVPLKPKFDLPTYKGLDVTSELEPVMEEQIDTTLDELRKQQSTPSPAGDDGLDEDGFVVANLKFEHDGNVVFDREGLRLNALSVPPGVDEELFKEGMLGAKEDESLEFPMTIPDMVEDESARGEKGTAKLVITSVMKLTPPTDDELVGIMGEDVQDMDGVRTFVRERLEENAQESENHRVETALLDRVISSTDIALPETMIESQTDARLAELAKQMESNGDSEEAIETAKDNERPGAKAEAEKGLKALLVVETIGETEELLVSSEDMDEELGKIALRNNTELDEVRKYYAENNLGQQLAIEILEKKVRRFLRENADIKAPS